MSHLFTSAKQATHYVACRPTYPLSLYTTLFSHLQELKTIKQENPTTTVVDMGCGSGQATYQLVEHFDRVIAVDPSKEQLAHAAPHKCISYIQGDEATNFPHDLLAREGIKKVDAVTVAQAAHWFNLPDFYKNVDRVLRVGGVLGIWTYGNIVFPNDDELGHQVTDELYEGLLIKGGYWDDRRRHVDEHYASLPRMGQLPEFAQRYEEKEVRDMQMMTAEWSKEQLFGYIRSWSGYVTYCQRKGIDPGDKERDPVVKILERWLEQERYSKGNLISVAFPLTLRISIKQKD